jgi:hypothetical protein
MDDWLVPLLADYGAIVSAGAATWGIATLVLSGGPTSQKT